MGKIKQSVAFREDLYNYINDYKEQYGLASFTCALESIVAEHRLSAQEDILKRLEDKYNENIKSLMMRLGYIDKNVGVLLEVLNTLLYSPAIGDLLYVPSDQAPHPIIESAVGTVTARVTHNQQKKDNQKKSIKK